MHGEQHNPGRAARSVAEFAAAYGLGIATVWRRIKAGDIVALKVGNRTIITESAERAWLANLPRVGKSAAA
jgi:hypothetical protein